MRRMQCALRKLLLAGAALWVAALPAQAFNPAFEKWADTLGVDLNASYQATRVMTSPQGTFEFAEHRAPQKLLMDMNFQGMEAALLMREDLQKSYMLMPSMGMYREMPMDQAMQQANGVDSLQEVAKVGEEKVNGHASTKFRAKFAGDNGSGEGFVWVTDSGVPIKMDMTFSNRGMQGERLVMELRDLKIGPQSADLFELPPNLKPMNFGGLGNLLKQR